MRGQCLAPMAGTGPGAGFLHCIPFDIKLVRLNSNNFCLWNPVPVDLFVSEWVGANIPKYPFFAGAAG